VKKCYYCLEKNKASLPIIFVARKNENIAKIKWQTSKSTLKVSQAMGNKMV
jgi:hypothetical protein